MTAKEIIILLSKQAGLTQEQVAARLGFDKANHIGDGEWILDGDDEGVTYKS